MDLLLSEEWLVCILSIVVIEMSRLGHKYVDIFKTVQCKYLLVPAKLHQIQVIAKNVDLCRDFPF